MEREGLFNIRRRAFVLATTVLAVLILSIAGAYAVGSFVTKQNYQPSFQTYYSREQINTYWPVLGDAESCEARQDILLQVAPAGCQPIVVRSDLLAEQNVPVFCQIDALKLNPLLDIKEIRNIRFTGNYPDSISGVGFHPARAALRTRDALLGSPLINNVGYVVLILKRNEIEKELPDSIEVTLSAQIDYDAGNAFGIGRAEFRLEEIADDDWELEKNKQSFWNGKFYARAEQIEPDFVVLGIYQGDKRVSSTRIEIGKKSGDVYVPGGYCRAALQISYDGLEAAKDKARVTISDDRGSEVVEVYKGSRFLNGKCAVNELNIEKAVSGFSVGSLGVSCGSERFVLSLKERTNVADVVDGSLEDDVRDAFEKAISEFVKVADDYPAEKNPLGGGRYGEEALREGIELSRVLKQETTRRSLMQNFVELYPQSEYSIKYKQELAEVGAIDGSGAVHALNVDNRFRIISLDSLQSVSEDKKPSADFAWGSQKVSVIEGGAYDNGQGGVISLESLGVDFARVSARCEGEVEFRSERIGIGESVSACGSVLKLDSVSLQSVAKIRIEPKTRLTRSETNLTVGVGIEKRAIKLSPDKTREMISNLDESVDKWEGISDNLGNVVDGFQSACFVTSAALTFKNLLEGFSGEALARQQVMRGDDGWTNRCKDDVASGKYVSLDACYLANSNLIDSDVKATQSALTKVNSDISGIEKKYSSSSGVLGKSVDSDSAKKELAELVRKKHGDKTINMPSGRVWGVGSEERKTQISVNELISEKNLESVSYSELRNIYMNLERRSVTGAESGLSESAGRIGDNVLLDYDLGRVRGKTSQGFAPPTPLSEDDRNKKYAPLVDASDISAINFGEGITKSATLSAVKTTGAFLGGTYILGLKEGSPGSKEYVVSEVYYDNNGVYERKSESAFVETYGVGNMVELNAQSYNNPMKEPRVKYYDNEPYKGMPAIVPVDVQRGWYAATKQTLPTFGGIGAFDASGRVSSFWLCNVGGNGRAEFDEGFGDDICQLVNLNTGQPLGSFPELSESEAERLVERSVKAINDAANQYGNKVVSVGGELFDVGLPAVGVPATQCQDFMSPDDCHLLFNVCDPVICPSSRCDFGGAYPVADVVQTGVVGSALLCLPNVKEKIYVPVCLTGIKAGIDAYTSILQSHRDCLQESLETGRTVGICDQIYSIYTCELFWRQVAPVANILLPKLVERAYGQGARGGGEYLTVQSAWKNTEKSVDFLTNNYGVNALRAFNIRSVEEVGTPFCKAFVSAKAPNSFESLIEPESPPQFHAWFSSTKYSDATVPATAQYKAFYHIYAGKNAGVYYSVYLKNPAQSSFFSVPGSVQIASGFVPKGEYASESKDFTAPEGYRELCVNINGEERCGFKQVSTSLALNVLKDSYVAEQIEQSDIQSESECISGSPSLGAVFAGGSSGAVAEEAGIPQIYDRGVVRICSSNNPGSSTDPTRFADVGYCDSDKIRCWLDKESVKNAISDSNQRVIGEETIIELEKRNAKLENSGLLNSGDGAAKINEAELEKDKLDAKDGSAVSALVSRIDEVSESLLLNYQKAWISLVKAEVLKKRVLSLSGMTREEKEQVKPLPPEKSSTTEENFESTKFSLSEIYFGQTIKEIFILRNGASTGVFIKSNVILYDNGANLEVIGNVEDNTIVLRTDKKKRIDSDFGFGFYEELDGAILNGKEVVKSSVLSGVSPGKAAETPQ